MNFYTTSVLALIIFYIFLLIIVFLFQRNLLYHPSVDNYLKDQAINEPSEIEKVKITTEDNEDTFLKLVKGITSKGFIRSNYKDKLVDLSNIRINLKSNK